MLTTAFATYRATVAQVVAALKQAALTKEPIGPAQTQFYVRLLERAEEEYERAIKQD